MARQMSTLTVGSKSFSLPLSYNGKMTEEEKSNIIKNMVGLYNHKGLTGGYSELVLFLDNQSGFSRPPLSESWMNMFNTALTDGNIQQTQEGKPTMKTTEHKFVNSENQIVTIHFPNDYTVAFTPSQKETLVNTWKEIMKAYGLSSYNQLLDYCEEHDVYFPPESWIFPSKEKTREQMLAELAKEQAQKDMVQTQTVKRETTSSPYATMKNVGQKPHDAVTNGVVMPDYANIIQWVVKTHQLKTRGFARIGSKFNNPDTQSVIIDFPNDNELRELFKKAGFQTGTSKPDVKDKKNGGTYEFELLVVSINRKQWEVLNKDGFIYQSKQQNTASQNMRITWE